MSADGYRVIKGNCKYNHSFGGHLWKTPNCPNCGTNLHLIFNFDLNDFRLEKLSNNKMNYIPLISCLNCSSYWSTQVFKIEPQTGTITILKQTDEERWITEEEDRLPYPLPFSKMGLEELHESDILSKEEDTDQAFEDFGSEYICRILDEPLFATEPIQKNKCYLCNEDMEYVATICSEDYDSEGLVHEGFTFNFGEAFLYFYFCKSCTILQTEMQST
ncbi:rRNA methylase [Paenibacillus tepidiphilus]|uniref:rRNA methylase n=1 Tax=Paenibacillus tepidiphilus TaxID=2608683 RepID=UPI00123A45DF|nr:rRNA methylase [Paenibacillus tepidiphilus]